MVRRVSGGLGAAVKVAGDGGRRRGRIDGGKGQESIAAPLVDMESVRIVSLKINAICSVGVDIVSAKGERSIEEKSLRGAAEKVERAGGLSMVND